MSYKQRPYSVNTPSIEHTTHWSVHYSEVAADAFQQVKYILGDVTFLNHRAVGAVLQKVINGHLYHFKTFQQAESRYSKSTRPSSQLQMLYPGSKLMLSSMSVPQLWNFSPWPQLTILIRSLFDY